MLSSYLQINIPYGSLFIGEVDLAGDIRPLGNDVCEHILNLFNVESGSIYSKQIKRVFISKDNSSSFRDCLAKSEISIDIISIKNLEDCVNKVFKI